MFTAIGMPRYSEPITVYMSFNIRVSTQRHEYMDCNESTDYNTVAAVRILLWCQAALLWCDSGEVVMKIKIGYQNRRKTELCNWSQGVMSIPDVIKYPVRIMMHPTQSV